MEPDHDFDLEAELEVLAQRLVRELGWHDEPLSRAVALDRLADCAGALRDGRVRSVMFHRRSSWRLVGERFGVSRQAASKRWGR